MTLTPTELEVGTKVKINIKEPEGYTSDLYNSIQGEQGYILRKQGEFSSYKDAYLIQFGKSALNKYRKTHSGKWANAMNVNDMAWWTETKDFDVIGGA